LARELGHAGNDVTFFLVQNGVMSARAGAMDAAFDQVVGGKIRVLADDFSLRERGINKETLKPGVLPGLIDEVVDLLAAARKRCGTDSRRCSATKARRHWDMQARNSIRMPCMVSPLRKKTIRIRRNGLNLSRRSQPKRM